MWREFVKALREVWRMSSGGVGSYRPDLHYMRGPGPKWHAKYGNPPERDSPGIAPDEPGLADAAKPRA